MRDLPIAAVHAPQDNCVRRVRLFSRLSAEQQDAVASFARPVALERGEWLHAAGASVGQLVVVHTGALKLVHTAAGGRERVLRLAEPGDVVGEHSFLTGARPDHRVEAVEASRLCTFRHADLGALVARYPAIAVAMLRDLSERLTDAQRRLVAEGEDVSVRVARYLLDLPADAGADAPAVRLPVAKTDVASLLGTTPESFSRALARLQRQGLVAVDGAEIALLDADALEAWRG